MTTTRDLAEFLEEQARQSEPITYSDVIVNFPDLPPLTEAWLSHPLCSIFGELDREDFTNNRPFRTALVFGKESGLPGNGFFQMLERYRGRKLRKDEHLTVWLAELDAIKKFYSKPQSN